MALKDMIWRTTTPHGTGTERYDNNGYGNPQKPTQGTRPPLRPMPTPDVAGRKSGGSLGQPLGTIGGAGGGTSG